MRNALIISLVFHLAMAFLSVRLHKITRVDFVERDVYTVQLVTPVEASEPPKETKRPEPPTPEPVEEEEIAPPEEKPKPKTKPKPEPPKKKAVPTTTIKKTKVDAQKTSPDSTALAETAVTGDIALDVEDFPFAYYISTIKTKIASFWRVPGTTQERIYCRVYFRIDRSGAVRSTAIETSSGNILFDQAAQRAVIQANPLPPLPQGFGDDYLGVHFSFAYEAE